jgi:hypothetical protein
MENEPIDYGHCETLDGVLKITNYIQTENIHGRQWTVIELEDKSIVLQIESKPEGLFETVKQTMRLSLKSISLLMLCLVEIDRDFKLNMESVLKEMLGDQKDVKIKFPKPETEPETTRA